ncbi:MAG: DUF2897 family protein [Plesiomonas sp.]|uniref:DUF2897 family protein n=1 Tax=Plesiomonas sp. TaxID=2486279 RepID=UPI003EE570A1
MALLAEIFSHKWLIIITVIAVIGGNLALLKATANMKIPKGKSYPSPKNRYDDDESDDENDNWGQVNKKQITDTSDTSLIKNATTTQQTKIDRKEDHNRNNDPQ